MIRVLNRFKRAKPFLITSTFVFLCALLYAMTPYVLAQESNSDGGDAGAGCGCCGALLIMIFAPIIGSVALIVIFLLVILLITAGIVWFIVRVAKKAWMKD